MSLRKLAQRLLDATRFGVEWSGLTRQVPEGTGRRRRSKWVPSGEYRVVLNPAGAVWGDQPLLTQLADRLNAEITGVLAGELVRAKELVRTAASKGTRVTTADALSMLDASVYLEQISSFRCEVRVKDDAHQLGLVGEYVITGDNAAARAEKLAAALDKILAPVREVAVAAAAKAVQDDKS